MVRIVFEKRLRVGRELADESVVILNIGGEGLVEDSTLSVEFLCLFVMIDV